MSKSVVLVTGGLTGIGRATALAFAREGASVVVSGRREDEGKALEASCAGSGRRPRSSRPMSATKTMSVVWSIRPWRVSAGWMSP